MPFTLQDEEISDEWECAQNIWDEEHNSCSIPQALTDEEIDEILASQVGNISVQHLMCLASFSVNSHHLCSLAAGHLLAL